MIVGGINIIGRKIGGDEREREKREEERNGVARREREGINNRQEVG